MKTIYKLLLSAGLCVCLVSPAFGYGWYPGKGEPIPVELREKIFRKFYQGDESHASMGNGIGLAIVRRVVKLHGGSVSVDCKNGQTTFTVELPRT